ncbi:MAG: hypothetical protein GY765_36660 [bacterium]|nr:hypothetical protein [bacterium]
MNPENALARIKEAVQSQNGTLNLSNLNLTHVPPELFQLTHLRQLRLDNNRLQELPEEIENLRALTDLDLSNNRLEHLPESFGKLSELERLYLFNNRLTHLCKGFSQLKSLDFLDVSWNRLTDFPPEIVELSTLGRLEMDNNGLANLPEGIGRLTELTALYLGNLREADIEDKGFLTRFREVKPPVNGIDTLPESMGNLLKLERLFLANLRLTDLPPVIGALPELKPNGVANIRLKGLALAGNPLGIPPAMCDLDAPVIAAYLKELQKNGGAGDDVDVFLMGKPSSEKVRLTGWLLGKELATDVPAQTDGFGKEAVIMGRLASHGVNIRLWDIEGFEQLQHINRYLVPGRCICVPLVFPVKDEKNVLDMCFLLSSIRSTVGDAPIVPVLFPGTVEKEKEIPQRLLQMLYPQIAFFLKMPGNGDDTGAAGLPAGLTEIAGQLPVPPLKIPACCVEIKERLLQIGRKEISFEVFDEILRQCIKDRDENLQRAIECLFVHLGILGNPERENTRESTVPCREAAPHGRWVDDSTSGRQGQSEIKIPGGLPIDIPVSFTWDSADSLGFQYRYRTLPGGLATDIIAFLYPYRRHADVWRTGMVLRHRENEIFISADLYNRFISIEVVGVGDRSASLNFVRAAVEVIHDGYHQKEVQPEGFLRLQEPGVDGKEGIYFSYKDLSVLYEEGIRAHYFPRLRRNLDIKKLWETFAGTSRLDAPYVKRLRERVDNGEIEAVLEECVHHPRLRQRGSAHEFDELQRQWRLLMADICNGRIKGDGAAGETDYLACKLTALIQHCR